MRSIKSEVLHEDACQHSKFYGNGLLKFRKGSLKSNEITSSTLF